MIEIKESYLSNPLIKKDGVSHNWTEYELIEYQKCMNDPAYFAENYIKIINLDKGLVNFKLYPYQRDMINHFNDNRFSVVLACRQSGKSISTLAYIMWYAIFHPEKNCAVLANKGETAREMLSRITLMLENLPFFLQPGCKSLNKGTIHFSNNSKIFARATSASSIRGSSVNLLMLDEFAFVENAIEFYTSTYPVISSGESSKIIITSTANGVGNMFHKIWEGAIQQVNEYKPFTVNWWDVPGRDEKWKEQTIANTSQIQFQQEYGNDFLGTGNTLVNAETLIDLRAETPIETKGPVKIYEKPQKDHDYILSVDVSHGGGGDYSVFNIVDVSVNPFKQVAVYRNNHIPPLLFPTEIAKWAHAYNEALVIVETNDQGSVVANGLYYDLEYPNMYVESMVKADGIGIKMTKRSKLLGCSSLKQIMESKKIKIVDADTIDELSTFEVRGNSFAASSGNHDDIVMTLVSFGYFVSTQFFADMTDINLREFLYKKKMREIEDDMVPFGVIDNGMSSIADELQLPQKGGWFVEEERSFF